MGKVDKRTVEASYVLELSMKCADEYPTVEQVLKRYLSKHGYGDAEINRIAIEETFDTVVSAMRYGDYLAIVKDVMEKFAKSDYKSLGDINGYIENILAKRFNVTEADVSVYEAIRPALLRLEKDGLIEVIDNPERAGWKLYKYIG